MNVMRRIKPILPTVLGIGCLSVLFANTVAWASPESDKALQSLIEGNTHFVTDHAGHPHQSHDVVLALAKGQHPIAVVLGCSDSRVAPEIIFDQGLGDIFDVRTAGEVLSPVVLGSIEYAIEHLNVPLIVVLGHQHCGAVKAALAHLHPQDNEKSLIQAIIPAVKQAEKQPGDTEENAVKNNIRNVMAKVAADPTLQAKIRSGQVGLVGGYYHLETGQVDVITTYQAMAH